MVAPRIDSVAVTEKIVTVLARRDDELDIRIGGRTYVVPYAVEGATISFSFDGEIYFVEAGDKGPRAKARHRDHSTEAPMPGAVLKILVRPGDVVKRGTPLVILEAMKMEHPIVAPRDGIVASVNCKEGELVHPGVELVTLK
jgi:3-methylcrotonyl-CoA carboxylase alpha subunit